MRHVRSVSGSGCCNTEKERKPSVPHDRGWANDYLMFSDNSCSVAKGSLMASEVLLWDLQMAKSLSAIIGIDLGRHSIKSVLMQRKGQRLAVTNYGVLNTGEELITVDQQCDALNELLSKMGGSGKSCVVAVSSNDALLRIIEQPRMEPSLLRNALRINDMALLNQSVRNYVLDCDRIRPACNPPAKDSADSPNATVPYLVGGLPRERVGYLNEAFSRLKWSLSAIQLAPVCSFNAFEFAKPEVFQNEAFIIVDIGHLSTTVTVGVKGELILIRTVEYGGATLMEALVTSSGNDREYCVMALEQWDQVTVDHARISLSTLTRELSSSIGFFEGRREETISRIFVSGGPIRSTAILKIMTEELHMPVEAWHPFEQCETLVSEARTRGFAEDFVNLNVACGAAVEQLKGSLKTHGSAS
jgi:type IV pilus assembly protein PilM